MHEILKKTLDNYKAGVCSFEECATLIARLQVQNCTVYHQYCLSLGIGLDQITEYDKIPFLPISAFKQHKVICSALPLVNNAIYASSGTTGMTRSYHHVADVQHYLFGAKELFEVAYGSLADYTIFALLPSYLERQDSSLVAMVSYFLELAKGGGFFLDETDKLYHALQQAEGKVLLIGVSFALMDFAEKYKVSASSDLIVMETGGMKGRHAELAREELHTLLKEGFGVDTIHSEYGMTELCSQAYSRGFGIFEETSTLKIRIREVSDPFACLPHERTGVVQCIDLQNIYSCSFIETEDLGRKHSDTQFSILGRLDNSDMRGCNLLV